MKNTPQSAGTQEKARSHELARQEPEVAQAIEREAARHEQEARRLRGQDASYLHEHDQWPTLSRLPMRLTAAIPLPRFCVKDLLALEEGHVIKSSWASTEDVPVKLGALPFGWSEFEVVEQRMAARLTRLA